MYQCTRLLKRQHVVSAYLTILKYYRSMDRNKLNSTTGSGSSNSMFTSGGGPNSTVNSYNNRIPDTVDL